MKSYPSGRHRPPGVVTDRRRRAGYLLLPLLAAALFLMGFQAQDPGTGGIPGAALLLLLGWAFVVGLAVAFVVLLAVICRRPPAPPQVDDEFRAYTRRAIR